MDPFYGEIRIFGFNYAPVDWATCQGQTMPLMQYQVLYTVIGTQFGGDGTSNFKLPNLMGSAVADQGQGAGLTLRQMGKSWGSSVLSLNTTQMPNHQHGIIGMVAPTASLANEPSATAHIARTFGQADFSNAATRDTTLSVQTIGSSGGGQPHENRQPYLAMNFCICLQGEYPIRQ